MTNSDAGDVAALVLMLGAFSLLALVSRALLALAAVRRASAWALGTRDIEPNDISLRERIRRLHWE
jgi:hypothetical protein